MKIFVVGGAGYIGSICAELLLNEGHEVAIFDNLSEGHRQAVDSRADFIQGELAHPEGLSVARQGVLVAAGGFARNPADGFAIRLLR